MSTLPVIHVIVDHVEALARQRPLHRLRIVAVRDNIPDLFPQFVARLAMQNGDVVAGVKQLLHQRLADEQSAANHQHLSLGGVLALGSVSRSTRGLDG